MKLNTKFNKLTSEDIEKMKKKQIERWINKHNLYGAIGSKDNLGFK